MSLISKFGREIDWNAKDRHGCNVLHCVASSADKEMLDVMCGVLGRKNVEKYFNATDKQGRTPWMLTLGKPRKKFIEHLLDKYSNCLDWLLVDNKGDNVLHYALSFCDADVLQMIVPHIASTQITKIVNWPNRQGETPLMSGSKNAILESQVRNIQVYCQQFGSVINWDQKSKFGRTYLHFPVSPEVMQCLTKVLSREQCTLFLSTPDDDGDTPLMRAATRGHTAMAKFLLNNFEMDTKVNVINKEWSEEISSLAISINPNFTNQTKQIPFDDVDA